MHLDGRARLWSWHQGAPKLRRLAEEEVVTHITTTDASVQRGAALRMLRAWCLSSPQRPQPPALIANGASTDEVVISQQLVHL